MYSQNEVLDFIKEEDVKFIRLAFFDVFGKQKNISIMAEQLPRAFKNGISFDASSIKGFETPEKSDLFLHPDPSTIVILPWRPSHGRVVRMFCDIRNPDGTPYKKDSRHILKEAVKKAGEAGLEFKFGPEIEFYLFKLDGNSCPTKIPFDGGGYMDIFPDDLGENVRRDICFTLEQMGIPPESSHHEEGPGQNEIDFHHSDAVSAADNTASFKWVVRTKASASGLSADFSPKPLAAKSGNGMHINISCVSSSGEDFSERITAGILAHIKEMTLFLNPHSESYERLGKHKAPKFISWGHGNRSALIRIPASTGGQKRIELRSPDPEANPYLAFALIIHAALDGIRNNIQLPPPVESDLENSALTENSGLEELPATLEEARRAAAESPFIKEILGESFFTSYGRE